ncbi:hypothetical protein AC629_42225 [Bradyrhizobium sp. NAS80.1]|nr:hypothetical protein AC629_42225 [Bradyrhizobium sp. NAS80.1]
MFGLVLPIMAYIDLGGLWMFGNHLTWTPLRIQQLIGDKRWRFECVGHGASRGSVGGRPRIAQTDAIVPR